MSPSGQTPEVALASPCPLPPVQTLLLESSRILLMPRRALHRRPREPTGFYNTLRPSDALTVAAREREAIGTTNITERCLSVEYRSWRMFVRESYTAVQ